MPATDDDTASGNGPPVPTALAGLGQGQQALAAVESVGLPIERLPDAAFENLLVVSVGRTPREIESVARRRGHGPQRVGVVPVSGTDTDYDGPMWCAPRVRPNDLTGISMRFSEGLEYVKPGTGWVLFDNITAMLMYGEQDRVFRLVDSLVSATRARNARGVFAIVREATGDDTYAQFRNLFDVEVEFG